MNQVADTESQTVRNRCDWLLHPGLFALIQEVVGPGGERSICVPSDSSTSTLLQLEAGPGSRGNRHVHSELKPASGIWKPPMVSLVSYAGENPMRFSKGDIGGPIVEDPVMVTSSPPANERIPTSDFDTRRHSNISNSGRNHNASGGSTVGCLATIQHCGRTGGLSEGASMLLESAWRDKTKSTYESLFKRWDCWCKERGRNAFRGPLVNILNFLADFFKEGYEYRLLNSYRKGLSIRDLRDQNLYNAVWDGDQVLSMFRSEGPSDFLPLQSLTIKTVMVMFLSCPCRGANLAALNLNNRSYVPEGVAFQATQSIKAITTVSPTS